MKAITKGLTAVMVITVAGGVLLYGQNCGTSVRHDETAGTGLSTGAGGTHLVDLDHGGQLPPGAPPAPYTPTYDASPTPYPPAGDASNPPVSATPSAEATATITATPTPSSSASTGAPTVFTPTVVDPQQSICRDLGDHLNQPEFLTELSLSTISQCGFKLIIDSLRDINADAITTADVRSNPFFEVNGAYCFFRFGLDYYGVKPYLTYWPAAKSTTVPTNQIVTIKYVTSNPNNGNGYRELRIMLEAPHQQQNGGWIAPAITCFHPNAEAEFTLFEIRGLVKNVFKIEVTK